MSRLIFGGLFFLAVASAGCASKRTAAPPPTPPTTVEASPAKPAIPEPPVIPAASAAATLDTPKIVPMVPPAPPVAAERPPAKTKTGASPRATKPVAAPMQPAAAKTPAPPAAPPPPPAKPTLNLTDLEQRLRETRAIGVFTKLSLKNQVDDLLSEFRSYYQGPNKHPTPALRQHYDLLLLKVLSLLQDADPPLAQAVASSREAIWGILADPEKFSKI